MRLVKQVSDTDHNLIPSHQNLVREMRLRIHVIIVYIYYLATKHIAIDFPSSILSAQILLSFPIGLTVILNFYFVN